MDVCWSVLKIRKQTFYLFLWSYPLVQSVVSLFRAFIVQSTMVHVSNILENYVRKTDLIVTFWRIFARIPSQSVRGGNLGAVVSKDRGTNY